ncbi:MAG TPA: hypothetical protein VH419_00300 [Nocardioidaceae bacterium]
MRDEAGWFRSTFQHDADAFVEAGLWLRSPLRRYVLALATAGAVLPRSLSRAHAGGGRTPRRSDEPAATGQTPPR